MAGNDWTRYRTLPREYAAFRLPFRRTAIYPTNMIGMRTILAVFFAALLVLTSGPMAVARHTLHGVTIVICTGEGVAKVTLDAHGEPIEPAPHCPDCLSALADVVLTPPAAELITPSRALIRDLAAPHALHTADTITAAARGPPAGGVLQMHPPHSPI